MFNQSAKKTENEFKEAIKVYASKTDDALRSGANNMKDKVESYPTTSILIAVGIGFILGFVSGRRWNKSAGNNKSREYNQCVIYSPKQKKENIWDI